VGQSDTPAGNSSKAEGEDIAGWVVCPSKHAKKKEQEENKISNKISASSYSSSVVQITPFVPPPPPPSNEKHVEALMKESEEHERGHRKKTEIRRSRSQRRTMARVKARAKLKQSKKMKKVELFAELDDSAISRLVDAMKLKKFKQGETIVEEGSTGDNSFYVIIEGSCSVKKAGRTVGRLQQFEHFGESSLVTVIQGEVQARNATVVADSGGAALVQALSLNANTLRALMEDGTVDRKQVMRGVRTAQLRRDAKERWGVTRSKISTARSLFS
jgi:CRP-like cAMP-binding protein